MILCGIIDLCRNIKFSEYLKETRESLPFHSYIYTEQEHLGMYPSGGLQTTHGESHLYNLHKVLDILDIGWGDLLHIQLAALFPGNVHIGKGDANIEGDVLEDLSSSVV